MSSPAPVLVPVIVTLTTTTTPLPAGNAPQQSVSVTVTDSAGTVYPAVVLTGAETPTPWSYAATYASGPASGACTALDTSGNPIDSPVDLSFVVTPAALPQTFQAPSGLSAVAAATNTATAQVHRASSLKA